MTVLPLALSLSNSFTQLGAIAAFVALVGIALLSLLLFSQARELKRLREWAGRSPERAAELEQRVSTAAAARATRGEAAGQQPVAGAQASRPVPRTTPINARAVTSGAPATRVAEGASAGDGVTGTAGQPAPTAPGVPPTGPGVTPAGAPAAPQPVPAGAVSAGSTGLSAGARAGFVAEDQPPSTVDSPSTGGSPPAVDSPSTVGSPPAVGSPPPVGEGRGGSPTAGASAVPAAGTSAGVLTPTDPARSDPGTPPSAPQPGVSAAASSAPAAASAPAASSAPRPATAAAATAAAGGALAGASKVAPRAAAPPPRRPPAPTGPPASGPRRTPPPAAAAAGAAAGITGEGARRSSPSPSARSTRGAGTARGRRSSPSALADPRAGRSPGRVTALIVGGVVVGIVVLALALTSLGGGGGGGKSASTGSKTTSGKRTGTTTHHTSSGGSPAGEPSATDPATTAVAVLNGTGTAGLAHRLSGTLRQSGYARATALDGRPSGVHQVTVVQYTSGHHGEAEDVARSLGVAQVQPMEAATASLAGASTVAVIAGADKATAP